MNRFKTATKQALYTTFSFSIFITPIGIGIISAILTPNLTTPVRIAFGIGLFVGMIGALASIELKKLPDYLKSPAPIEQPVNKNYSKYVSSEAQDKKKSFNYSNNNGEFCIGLFPYQFVLKFSKASKTYIHLYNDPETIKTIAIVKDKSNIYDIDDATQYDTSSRVRALKLNQIAVLQNNHGYYAAIKILAIKDDSRGDDVDEVEFEYVIQTNCSPDFTSCKKKD